MCLEKFLVESMDGIVYSGSVGIVDDLAPIDTLPLGSSKREIDNFRVREYVQSSETGTQAELLHLVFQRQRSCARHTNIDNVEAHDEEGARSAGRGAGCEQNVALN